MNEHRRATVSLCMIVRNEERNLADCLAPVAKLFDEIVIIDTGSTDQTKEIARRFTSNVFDFPWCDDFSAARNESLRRSQGDWVFWLDADDRVRDGNVEKLQQLLNSLADEPKAYLMDTVCWSHYECEPPRLITHPRLFRRHPDVRWRGRVHEQLRPEPVSLGYELLWSDVCIDHVGYQDDGLKQRKLHRDVRLLRMDYAVDPDDTSTLIHLGLTYARLAQHNEARKYLLKLLSDKHGASEWMRRIYGTLAELSLREGKFNDALHVVARGLTYFPDDENLLFMRAECFYELDEFDAASQTLQQIIRGEGGHHYHGGAPGDLKRKLAPRKLGDVQRVQGRHANAVATLQTVLNEFPNDTLTWYSLGRVYSDAQAGQQVEAIANRIRTCPQGDVFASLLVGNWHLDHNELAAAESVIDDLIEAAPQMPLPRLMRVDLLNRCDAPVPSRILACRDLLRVQPGNQDGIRLLAELEELERRGSHVGVEDWCTSVVLGEGVPGVIRV